MLPQTHAILHYVENLAGLAPKCKLHAAIAESVICAVQDIVTNNVSRWYRAEPDKKIAVRLLVLRLMCCYNVNGVSQVGEELANTVLPPLLDSLDAYLKSHVQNGFIKGSMSAADILVYQVFSGLQRGDYPFLPNGFPDFSTRYSALNSVSFLYMLHL